MKALLIYPLFPRTYWGQEYTNAITGKRAVVPPLGLITAAALLPKHWQLKLVDMNVEELSDQELKWADVVMVSAMRLQSESFHQVVKRAHGFGKLVVAGGPYVTTAPEDAGDADYLVLGEAEEILPELARTLEQLGPLEPPEPTKVPRTFQAKERPLVSSSPTPRFDLLRLQRYNAIGVQFSRGCPFSCEFCDIVPVFGRIPRTKDTDQFLRELDAVFELGFRGAIFVVDDNLIGNKAAAKVMLRDLAEWSRRHHFPFDFFTEASMNLANDDELIRGLRDAGFSAVFLGIETPSREALLEAKKRQNVNLDLSAAVEKLVRNGLDVMAGFIVGFDSDGEDIFDRQLDFIGRSPISMALTGILLALPGTALWQRLESEGRLKGGCVGDTAYRPNFVTRMPEETLVAGYRRLLAALYAPRAYFARALRNLELQRGLDRPQYRRPARAGFRALLGSLWLQGLRSKYRRDYWHFLAKATFGSPKQFAHAIALAIVGEHMIRYTQEDVLPRLRPDIATLAEAQTPPKRVAASERLTA